jgi:formylglycine-generating enzyme required for sulfatase activity
MEPIPGRSFTMGCVSGKGCSDREKPLRPVTVAPFLMGRHEVTFEEYDAFAQATGRRLPNDQGWGRGRRPVINITWYDAVAYADWLSLMTGKRFRLSTEAEWEYAARAGTETQYWWGNEIRQDGKVWANCEGCGSEWDDKRTAPVGRFTANAFGLYDTAGNVWEWVQDCWHSDYDGAPTDGHRAWGSENRGDCGLRVLRGGSWYDRPRRLRSANRYRGNPLDGNNNVGFRLAQDL